MRVGAAVELAIESDGLELGVERLEALKEREDRASEPRDDALRVKEGLARGQQRLTLGALDMLPVADEAEVGAVELLGDEPRGAIQLALLIIAQRPVAGGLGDLGIRVVRVHERALRVSPVEPRWRVD